MGKNIEQIQLQLYGPRSYKNTIFTISKYANIYAMKKLLLG